MLRRLLDGAGYWNKDRLRIFLHPQQLVAVRTSRNKIILKKIVSCPADNPIPGNGDGNSNESWSPAITAFSGLLREEGWQGAKPQLVLSNHFVRYALIPWHASLGSHAERQAFLRHNFQLVYGDAARNWDLRVSDNGMHRTALASGVEQRLLMDLHAVFQNAGLKAGEIYPHFMMAINQAQQITHDAYWFVVVESDRLCVALIQDGHWRSIKSCACSADIPWQISMLIERESVISGIATDGWPVVIYWPGRAVYQEVDIAGRAVDWVQTPDLYSSLEKSGLKKFMRADRQNTTSDELSPYELALWI